MSGPPGMASSSDLKTRPCLVVFSGGQDSTTCLHWALGAFQSVEAVFFDYGQRHASELGAAQAIADRLKVRLRVFRLDFFREMGGNALVDPTLAIESGAGGGAPPNTFVPGRNLIFLTYAASYAFTLGIRDLVTGVCQTDYSGYPDCRDATMKSLERALGLGLGWSVDGQSDPPPRAFSIHTPLMFQSKAESVRWAAEIGALDSLALSHTCYEGMFPPCGRCPACELRAKGFAEAGIPDPLMERVARGR